MATNIQNLSFDERLRMAQEAARQQGVSEDVINQMTQRAMQTNQKPATQTQSEEGKKGIAGVALGFAKEAGQTVSNLGTMGQKTLQKITNPIVKGISGDPVQNTMALNDALGDKLETRGTAEKVGGMVENVGEFFIPGGAATKAGKLVEGSIAATKAPALIKSAVKAVTSAGIEGLAGAGISGVQEMSLDSAKQAGIVNAGLSVISRPITKIIEQAPINAWANILKRTSSQVKKNPILPADAAKTGLIGTKESLVNQSKAAIQSIELQLDDLLSKSKKTVDGTKVAQYIQELKDTYKNIPGESYAVNILGTLQQEVREKGAMSVLDANKLKRDIYQVIEDSYGKGSLDVPSKVAGQKLIASGIKQEIEKVIPQVKDLNQKQAVYVQIRKAIKRQLEQGEGRGIAGVKLGGYDLLTGGLGTIGGAATGNPLAGIALVGVKKAVESPITQSAIARLARYFDELSPTKKQLFYETLKGLGTKGSTSE